MGLALGAQYAGGRNLAQGAMSFWGQSPNSPGLWLARRVQRVALLRNGCLTPITQWLACMNQAMVKSGVDEALRVRLNASFFQTADWVRRKRE